MFTTHTTTTSAIQHAVWVQEEGDEPMCLSFEPGTTIIDHLKAKVLGDARGKYKTFFSQQYVSPGMLVPDDTSDDKPIVFKLIPRRRKRVFFVIEINH